MFVSTDAALYFVVRFLVDECISSVSVKRVLSPPPSSISVGDKCRVKWTDGDYEAIALVKGTRMLARGLCRSLKFVSVMNFFQLQVMC